MLSKLMSTWPYMEDRPFNPRQKVENWVEEFKREFSGYETEIDRDLFMRYSYMLLDDDLAGKSSVNNLSDSDLEALRTKWMEGPDEYEPVILEIGAGTNPDPEATHTLDKRTDIPVDFPGIDIANDPLPFDDECVDQVVGYHILEHIPREKIGHVFREIDRILKLEGTGHIELPHTGTWSAGTDPTHQGPGGTTPDVANYLDGNDSSYWPEINWSVDSYAVLHFPTFLRPALRPDVVSKNHSREWVKLPFVDGTVIIKFQKREK
jgi:SAM-dependent methyltransferase